MREALDGVADPLAQLRRPLDDARIARDGQPISVIERRRRSMRPIRRKNSSCIARLVAPGGDSPGSSCARVFALTLGVEDGAARGVRAFFRALAALGRPGSMRRELLTGLLPVKEAA